MWASEVVLVVAHGLKAEPKLRVSLHPLGSNCHEISPCHDTSLSTANGVVGGVVRRDLRLPGVRFWEDRELVLIGVREWEP